MRKHFPIALLLLGAVAFAGGLAELFKLRFESGDVYPPYSSLRSDPLGTMAFYEGLEAVPGLAVRRDFSTTDRLPEGRGAAYLHLAAQTTDWNWIPEETAKEIDAFLGNGGRLVITFFPQTAKPSRFLDNSSSQPSANSSGKKKSKSGKTAEPAKSDRRKDSSREEEERRLGRTSFKKRWGVDFGFAALEPGEADTYEPATVVNQTDLPLPAKLDWHSAMIFTNLDKSWQTIYARGGNPVLVERRSGAGAIAMATDSYFLSNEAMRKARHADLLAWVVGPGQAVVFDEAHLGITESPGVAALMRKYRLHGLAAGLILLAGLFIWKNSMSLVPPCPDEAQPGYVAGKEAAAGFVNLLRRNIAPRDLLNVCFAEWTKSLARGGAHVIARVDQAQALIEAENARPPGQRNPVRTYQEICRALKSPGPNNLPSLANENSRDRLEARPARKANQEPAAP